MNAFEFDSYFVIFTDSGKPYLSDAHKSVIRRLFGREVQAVISSENGMGLREHTIYLSELYSNRIRDQSLDRYAPGYDDIVQVCIF